jgi:type IV secretory pathway VirB3-like protein
MRCVAETFLANRCIQKDEQRIRILERYHFMARRARSIISSFWKGSNYNEIESILKHLDEHY